MPLTRKLMWTSRQNILLMSLLVSTVTMRRVMVLSFPTANKLTRFNNRVLITNSIENDNVNKFWKRHSSSNDRNGNNEIDGTATITTTSNDKPAIDTSVHSVDDDNNNENNKSSSTNNNGIATNARSPWNNPALEEILRKKMKSNNAPRFRQHVNPLARNFQQPTILPDDWPNCVFNDLSKPLHLDIGCGKGGFLLDFAATKQQPGGRGMVTTTFNHIGLEIRPLVAQYAKTRISKHDLEGQLDFIGCNANVDLERLLAKYQEASSSSRAGNNKPFLELVTIQFPDPHFKKQHAKRRVVTPNLVQTLANFMPQGAIVFLQSDVKEVLDEMRIQFREHDQYFEDQFENSEDYLATNMLGVPTEREISVLENDLPVYRTTFTRNGNPI